MKHGTSTAYVTHKCRCDVCKTAHSKRQKRYRLDRARGVAKLVDAQPLRDHVDALYAAGMSQWDITIAAGWKSRNALADAYRRSKVTPRTMARVLAVTAPPESRRNGYVDATASRRRLQALAVLGWSSRRIAARLGNLDPQTYQFIQSGRNRTIRRRTEQAIAALYDQLWDQAGPSPRTRGLALRKGWLPPLAYDDISDPNEIPGGIRPELVEEAMKQPNRWMTFDERFWGRISKSEGCWEWQGKLTAKGYGQRLTDKGRKMYPHQWAYVLAYGEIPAGLVIDHLCRNRSCVNPRHLEAVTAEENTRRGVDARWSEPCPNGHDPAVYRKAMSNGKNICVQCRRDADNRRDWNDREARRAAARARHASKGRSERGRRVEELVEDWHDTWDYHQGDLEVAAARLGISRKTLEKNLSRARAKGITFRTREVAA